MGLSGRIMNKPAAQKMSRGSPSQKLVTRKTVFSASDWVVMILVLLLSPAVLYWMVPFLGKFTIGNDYLNYWINNQMFLMFSVFTGTFPLYAPGFNGGWTSGALTLGQLFHPISWLAAIIPGYWNGYAFQIGTLLRLLELGATCAVIFLFLRKLRLAISLAFMLAFITVYNLRMLDMFRYGASLENYTAMLLLDVVIGWFYLAPNRLLPFCIAVCSWLLVAGGHPQMMFIGFLGSAFVCVVFPFYASCFLPDELPPDFRRLFRFWEQTAISAGLGILLASAYTLPFYFEYLKESSRGAGIDFGYACSEQDTIAGIICNFFNPFFSDVAGSFGGSSLILLAVLFPLVGIFYLRRAWPVFVLWAGCVVILIMSAGSNGPLYYYFWKYVPFAQTFRIPGRFCMVLPFIFMLILVWIFRQQTIYLRSRKVFFDPVASALAVALILFIAPKGFDYSALTAAGRYVPANINDVPPNAVSLFFVCGLIALVSMIIYRFPGKLKTLAALILLASVIVGSAAVLGYGTWIVKGFKKTMTFDQMLSEQRQRLAYRPATGDWSRVIIEEHLRHTFLEPTMARVCRKYEVVDSIQESYQCLDKLREIDLVYVQGWQGAKQESKSADSDPNIDTVELKYDSFNNFIFDVVCAQPAFFVFSFPYSSRWQATVDGQNATTYRCNAIEQGIWLLPGKHSVEFRYRSPATTVGAVLCCLAIVLIVWLSLRGKARQIVLLVAVVLSALALAIWYRSLYQGGNIGTHYIWTSHQIQPNLSSNYNLAYGKKTSMSKAGVESYLSDSSLGVDGDRDGYFGFLTNTQEHTWWQVDLDKDVQVGEIDIYKMRNGYSKFAVPFDVMFSQDGKNWSLVQTIETNDAGNCWRIPVPGIKTRFVRIQTSRVGLLALAEVEIYK